VTVTPQPAAVSRFPSTARTSSIASARSTGSGRQFVELPSTVVVPSPVLSPLASGVASSDETSSRGAAAAPVDLPEAPTGPLGAVSSVAATALAVAGTVGCVLLLFSLLVPQLLRRLEGVAAAWRPAPFLSLLERPG
jgi:hypothetical protein